MWMPPHPLCIGAQPNSRWTPGFEGYSGGHVQFPIIHIKGDQLGVIGVYRTEGG